LAKNKPVELIYDKAGLLMQYPQKYQLSSQKVMKFQVLKEEIANSMMSGSFRGSFMIPVTTLIM
jgi:hypothetical protein